MNWQTLYETCWRYNIQLNARHISRQLNQAADSLSKLKMEHFHALVPNASPRAKKSKKLLFIVPLTCLEYTNRAASQQTLYSVNR